MNNPNPFVPKGSILEAQSKRRSRLKLAVFCVIAVGVAGLSAMLIQGCKREQPVEPVENPTMSLDTTVAPATSINATSTPPAAVTSSNVTPAVVTPEVVIPPPAPAMTEYVVVKGDSLATIAKKNGVSVKALETANPGVVPTKLKVGSKLQIPAPAAGAVTPTAMATTADAGAQTYTVKSGDTLSKIAKAHSTTVKAIQTENNLTTTAIRVGQKLKLPAKAVAAAPAPVAPAPTVETMPAAPMTPPAGTMPGH